MLSSVAGTVKRAWPALVFLSLARAMSHRTAKNKLIPAVVTNQKKALSAVAKSMPKSLAKATLVQLQVPVSGPMRMATIFSNDQILAKGVKDTSDIIYVNVIAPDADRKDMSVLKFISETYSRLWDEMVFNNKLSLQCVVFQDSEHVLSTRRQLLSSAKLPIEVVYVAAGVELSSDDALRNRLGLPTARVERVAFADDCEGMYFVDCEEQALPYFKKVALGGTFDRLHNGHKKLLSIGCCVCTDTLVIGVMGDDLLKNKSNADMIHGCAERIRQVTSYVRQIKPDLPHIDAVELADPFGPALSDPDVEAIVVSSETIAGANKINALRREKKYKDLKVVVIRRSDVATLSSTFLRDRSVSY